MKCLGGFAALFLATIAPACSDVCPETGLPPEGGPCSVKGQTCGELDACGSGPQAVCLDGAWTINRHDECGCGLSCEPSCPDTQPMVGSACSDEGAMCSYTDPSCNQAGADATCLGGVWSVSVFGPSCVPTCPATLPAEGTPCNACCLSSTCAYLDASGCPVGAVCTNGVWVTSAKACTPTSQCATLDESQCLGAQACRWMTYVTGCLTGQGGFPQGCYPADDCTSDAECNGGTCSKVEVDPCPGGGCSPCASEAHICVP